MGFGDVKLAFLIGLNSCCIYYYWFVPWLFIWCYCGNYNDYFEKRQKDSEIPFAPFLLLGMFVAYFFGEIILNWYLSLI